MERIARSQEERDKLEWLKRAKDKVISQRKAAEKAEARRKAGSSKDSPGLAVKTG